MTAFVMIIIMMALIGLDQLTKWWAVQTLASGHEIKIWEGVLHFTYLENRGAAWGIFSGKQIFLIILTAVIIVAMLVYLFKMSKSQENLGYKIAFILIISGAIGNLIDRIRLQYVIDFIYFKLIDFPIFNVADILVVCGVFLLMLCVLLEEKKTQNEEVDK